MSKEIAVFLVYDRNNDGIINDGKELFGPTTGNGFAELSSYDDDGNGWIDESDSVFSKLKIWTKNEEDRDILFSLKDKKIGAVYLNSINSIFHIKNMNNEEIAKIRKMSVFLYEDGNTGTAIHVGLKV
ncbi:MAG: hypothetical protein QMD43_05210 [Thermodesulfovibrio sp.]|nr:hypothetical protein [Thermodesulfovibrio sp.]